MNLCKNCKYRKGRFSRKKWRCKQVVLFSLLDGKESFQLCVSVRRALKDKNCPLFRWAEKAAAKTLKEKRRTKNG